MHNRIHTLLAGAFFSILMCCHIAAEQDAVVDATQKEEQETRTIQVDAHPHGGVVVKTPCIHALHNAQTLYLGAHDTGYKKDALVQVVMHPERGPSCTPLAHEKVVINTVKECPSPLYNKAIKLLRATQDSLFIVTKDQPGIVHCYQSVANPEHARVYSVKLADQFGKPCVIERIEYINQFKNNGYLLALVRPLDTSKEKGGLALAVAHFYTEVTVKEIKKSDKTKNDEQEDTAQEEKKEKITRQYFVPVDVINGIQGVAKAAPIDSLFTGSQWAGFNEGIKECRITTIYINQRIYIGLEMETANKTNSRTCALLVGHLEKNTLQIWPFAPAAICQDDTHIIGASGAKKRVAVHKMVRMQTSTTLDYLIVVGGVANAQTTHKTVYALPVVTYLSTVDDDQAWKSLGTMASKHAEPQVHPYTQDHKFHKHLFFNRTCEQSVTTIDDAPTVHDRAACVGANKQLPGPIEDIQVRGDTVYVAIATSDTKQAPGIFFSQSIIDDQGKIAAWTPWQRTAGMTSAATAIRFNSAGQCSYLSPGNGENEQLILRQSGWFAHADTIEQHNASSELMGMMQQLFPHEIAGVQGLCDVPAETPGVSGTDPVSLLIATGYQRVMLVQTNAIQDGTVAQYTGSWKQNILRCDNGVVNSVAEQKPQALFCTGGTLNELGPITCAHVASNGTDSWLFVGGALGVAVLSTAEGCGWSAERGIGDQFAGLTDDLVFKRIGSHRFVSKIMSDEKNLYILTEDRLDSVPLDTRYFKQEGTCVTRALVTAQQLRSEYGSISFADAIVSHDILLLATPRGLLASTPFKREWHRIEVPATCQSIVRLVGCSPTGLERDVADKGQLYVVASSLSAHKSSITRLFLDYAHDEPIACVPDYYEMNTIRPWKFYQSYMQDFITDGAYHITTRSGHGTTGAAVEISKKRSLPLLLDTAARIQDVTRSSASGSLWIVTNNGIRVHE